MERWPVAGGATQQDMAGSHAGAVHIQWDCEPWEEDFIEDDYYGDEWEDEEEKSK